MVRLLCFMIQRVCVIGVGFFGIVVVKNLKDVGLEVMVFDRGNEVGGNWVFDVESGYSSVFETMYIISSKKFS